MTAGDVRLWQTMTFTDVEAMMTWLTAVGFTEHATHRDEQDSSVVVHAEWLWPPGGGIMFGSPRPGSPVGSAGHCATYLVTPEPDAVFERAVAAGATIERPMVAQDYGGRGGSVRDPEGNHWSFGDYQPS